MPLAILSALLFIGCADTSISAIESDNHSYQLIKLSQKAGQSVENALSVTKTINGDEGGSIKLMGSSVTEDGYTIKIDMKIKVKKHSFSGDVDITITVDDVYAAVMFTPNVEAKKYQLKI